MNRAWWRVADLLCRALEPDERDAVRGDLAESGESGGRALLGMLGLVLRRKAALWKDWRPWLALALAAALAMMISTALWRTTMYMATYTWLYVRDWSFTPRQGFSFPRGLLTTYLQVGCRAWVAGFAVGSLSRRTIRINGALLCLVLLSGYVQYRPFPIRPPYFGIPASWGFAIYRVVFPLLVAATPVLPAVWGMRLGRRPGAGSPRLRTILWAAAATSLATQIAIIWFLSGHTKFELQARGISPFVSFFWFLSIYWPIGYLAASVAHFLPKCLHEEAHS